MAMFLLLDENDAEIADLDFDVIAQGYDSEKMFGLKNVTTSTINNVYLRFFPGIKGNNAQNTTGYSVKNAFVIRMKSSGEVQKIAVDKDDAAGELTLSTARGKAFIENTGVFTDYSTGNISMMDSSSDVFYMGCDDPYCGIYFEFSTPGNYTGIDFEYWNGSAWTDMAGHTDGTSNLTVDGYLDLGSTVLAAWDKTPINGFNMYWIRIKCSAKTTQAVSDVCYWAYNYLTDYSFIYDVPIIYKKSTDATPVYTDVTSSAIYSYHNKGLYCFDAEPYDSAGGELLLATYSYKIPQKGTYAFTYPSSSTCQVNAGATIPIVADGSTFCSNVIGGLTILFYTGIEVTYQATIEVSDALESCFLALDSTGTPGTYTNGDLNLGNITSNDTVYFWIKFCPGVTLTETTNTRYVSIFALSEG